MEDDTYQGSSKFTKALPSEQSNGQNRRDVGDLRCSGEEFGDNELSRRLSQFGKDFRNSESSLLKFEWNRLLLGPDPSRMRMDSSQSSYLSAPYGFTSTGDFARRQISEQVDGFECKEDSTVSLKKDIHVAYEKSPDLSLSESTQEDYISLEGYTDMTDDIELPCEEHFSRVAEVQGDLYKQNLSCEEDSDILLTDKHEDKQCLDESERSIKPYAALLKPKRNIQKKSFMIISLSNVISTESTHLVRRGPKEVNARITRWRSSEISEESNQLVNSEFLKYFKQLNETSAQRKSFTVNSGRIKCSVCGSDSKVFVDCNSLIAHAFGCQIPELRTKHLGFHKALCALMGWKSGTHLEKSWRYRQKLSDDEAIALKEDLIIWPPVIIIHNNSIQSKNPDDRILVSIEELGTMLKEMGYVGSVCKGRPANRIMVVKFNSTLPGLQEAERLHKYYCVTNHGRSDLQRVKVSIVNSKKESVLFGYLGLAEDLDKLHFETKKRCFLKSKKEIQEIVDATL